MSNAGDNDAKGNLKARWAALSEGEVSGPVVANVRPVSTGTGPQLSPEQERAQARAVAKTQTGEVPAPPTESKTSIPPSHESASSSSEPAEPLPYGLAQATGRWQKALPIGGAAALGLIAGALSLVTWLIPWFDIGIGMAIAALLVPYRRWHGATFREYNPILFGGVLLVHAIKTGFLFVLVVGFSGWTVAEFFEAFFYMEVFGAELDGVLGLVAEIILVVVSLVAAAATAHQMKDDTLDVI